MTSIMTKSGKNTRLPPKSEIDRYNGKTMLLIDLIYRYKNQRQATAFANKFKKLAKINHCKINIKFVKDD